MLRTHTCGALGLIDSGTTVTLSGWVQKIRDKGKIIWIDLRDRYGITQLLIEEKVAANNVVNNARALGREYVIQVVGKVVKRMAPNHKLATGEVEIQVTTLTILNKANVPPFLIGEETDGHEELRMVYRYLDLRRPPLQRNIILRHQVMQYVRNYLNQQQFLDIETPTLIKSTPEGARDFIVPARMHPGSYYALPQSPQIFKQLLMVAGFDRYYQIVKCFRDEDLRADRQPEFTQIDCELSFVTEKDIFAIFEGLIKGLFKTLLGVELPPFQSISYQDAMTLYGSDKPDLRFGISFVNLTSYAQGHGFPMFDRGEVVVAICVENCAHYTRKQLDQLTTFVKQPQVGGEGLVYVKYNKDGTIKSSVDKYIPQATLHSWLATAKGAPGDLLLILAGEKLPTQQALSALRLKMGRDLDLCKKTPFVPLWVVDFPLFEWDAYEKRYHVVHHPFTAINETDRPLLTTQPAMVRSRAYDLVINGVEVGGGSIRIHEHALQEKIFTLLGFSKETSQSQFGFLLDALQSGAPPHGGIAIGLDRLCALLGGGDSIRSYIPFPKNNGGRDVMAQAPSVVE